MQISCSEAGPREEQRARATLKQRANGRAAAAAGEAAALFP